MSVCYHRIGSTVPLSLHLLYRGRPVTGESPTVELRRLSDGLYFDFSAAQAPFWIDSGGMREGQLAEVVWLPGLYLRQWDHSFYDNGTPGLYAAIYRNPDPRFVERVEYVEFTFEWYKDAILSRKLLSNKSELTEISATQYQHRWFDDDGTTELLTHNITKSGNVEKREP